MQIIKTKKIPERNLSDYLLKSNFEKYEIEIETRKFEDENAILAKVSFSHIYNDLENYKNPLGKFHLSQNLAQNLIYQTLIGYFCTIRKKSKKDLGEFLGQNFSIECLKSININLEDKITINIDFEKINQTKYGEKIFGLFEIENHSFLGSFQGIVPY